MASGEILCPYCGKPFSDKTNLDRAIANTENYDNGGHHVRHDCGKVCYISMHRTVVIDGISKTDKQKMDDWGG